MSSSQQVKVEVMNALAGIVACIDNRTIARVETVRASEIGDYREEVAKQRFVPGRSLGKRCKMVLRNDEDVRRCLGMDVREGNTLVIFMKALHGNRSGYDLAKEAV